MTHSNYVNRIMNYYEMYMYAITLLQHVKYYLHCRVYVYFV